MAENHVPYSRHDPTYKLPIDDEYVPVRVGRKMHTVVKMFATNRCMPITVAVHVLLKAGLKELWSEEVQQ